MNPRSTLDGAVALAARMPGPLLPVGVLAAAAASTGSMFTTATLTAAALVGGSISAPAASAAAERFGARNVLLVSAIAHVLMLVLIVSSVERLTRGDTLTSNATIYTLLLVATLLAGLSTPAVATFSRAASWRASAGIPVRSGLRTEARIDDAAMITAPLLLVLLSVNFGPTVGLVCSAVLTAVAVPIYAMDRTHPSELPEDSARLPLGGAEHAQQQLLEQSGLLPEGPAQPGASGVIGPEDQPFEARSSAVEQPAPEQSAQTQDWGRGISSAILLAAAMGLVLGGLWITALDAAQALLRPSLFALTLGLIAAAGVLGARWRPESFTAPRMLRRRRLHASVLCLLSLLLLPLAVALPAGLASVLPVSVLAVLQGAVLGRLVLGLYSGLAIGVPAHRVPTVLISMAGGVLLGIALGLTLAGIAADELGTGFAAAVVAAGSVLAVVVVFSGQLWGSPKPSLGSSAPASRLD